MSPFSTLKSNSSRAKSIARNIHRLLKKHNLSEVDLARALNIPVMTVRRLASGETTDPRISTLKLFADYFEVTIDYLTCESNSYNEITSTKSTNPDFIPVLTWREIEAISNLEAINRTEWEHWHPISMPGIDKISKHCFALETKPTMQPRFPQGTLLVVNVLEPTQDGDLVLIRMNDNKVSLKEMISDPPNKILYPTLQGSEAIPYNSKLHKIIGVVILTLMYPRKR